MPIPIAQLETWSKQGAITTAKNTRQAIYDALNERLAECDYLWDVYLQGSYGNDTNIWADSDVDIVIELTSIFAYNLDRLDPLEQGALRGTFHPASTTLGEFRDDVINALETQFGTDAVTVGHKCIKVAEAPGRYPADVVAAKQYRQYYRDSYTQAFLYHRGILFEALPERREIVNFPKQHHDNGEAKMQLGSTDRKFKRTVRVFKNMRNCMIDRGYIDADLAPSYFLQCLIYNAPDGLFRPNLQETVYGILNWAWGLQDYEWVALTCQNEIVDLFGPTPEQWDVTNAQYFVLRACQLWNDWS